MSISLVEAGLMDVVPRYWEEVMVLMKQMGIGAR